MLRRDKRKPTRNTHLDLIRLFDNQQKYKNFPVYNISRGGLCFSSNESFDVDERVQITVFEEQQIIHQALGRICYRTETNSGNDVYGLSFLDNYILKTPFHHS